MVAVLASAAVLIPAPGGTSVARASFEPMVLSSYDYSQGSMLDSAADSLGDFDTASGPADGGLSAHSDALGYDLGAVIEGQGMVPRVTLASMPSDLNRIRETEQRKAVFFKSVLPLVLQVNEQIVEDRKRLWALSVSVKAGETPDAVDRLWLAVMADRYNTRRGDIGALLKRHDVVPPSLALAQAATESAWGTSRFVREGNAMFGQWTFSDRHDGIVPNAREDDKTHRVRAFDSLYESVLSYVTNLNKHNAYKEFRLLRADMRANGRALDGVRLAATLHRYSERGADYVSELLAIIQGNDLERLDTARLSPTDVVDPVI